MPTVAAGVLAPAVVEGEKFVGILRRPDRLSAAVCAFGREGDAPITTLEERAPATAGADAAPHLLAAWDRLARPRPLDASACADALTVLLGSLPARDALRSDRDPLALRQRGARRCWRQSLCDPRLWPALRRTLLEEGGDVRARLLARGLDDTRLCGLERAADPYLAYHHGLHRVSLRAYPRRFTASVLPALRGLEESEVKRALRAYWGLGLDRQDGLLADAVRLLLRPPAAAMIDWLVALTRVPVDQRQPFLALLIAAGAPAPAAGQLPTEAVDAALAGEPALWEDRWSLLVEGMKRRWSAADLVGLFRLANRFSPGCRLFGEDSCAFVEWQTARSLPPAFLPALTSLLERLDNEDPGAECSFALHLFTRCHDLPTLAARITRGEFLDGPAALVRERLRFLSAWPRGTEGGPRAYPQARSHGIEAALDSAPESHRSRVYREVESALVRWRRPEDLDRYLPTFLGLCTRLCRPPFDAERPLRSALTALVEAAGTRDRARLLSAPDRSFRRLEGAVRLDHQQGLVAAGLGALAKGMGPLVVDALLRHPEPLFRAARTLGTLRTGHQLQIVGRLRRQPIFRRGLFGLSTPELCALVLDGLGPRSSVIPRRLRLHLVEGRGLTEASVARHRQTILRRLVPARLAFIEQAVLQQRALAMGVPPSDARVRHALLLAGGLYENRRVLRRFLKAWSRGDRGFVARHPANLAWLKKHARLRLAAWTGDGFCFEAGNVAPGGARIAPEQDPLEVLRMGTLVGSCLSLGAGNEHSAVAFALDANKKVLFMRRPDGAFVARQAVAISEDDRLVCFTVYPLSADEPVQEAFLACDAALGAALGLRLVRGGPEAESYEVARVVAKEWYDDGVWDRLAAAPKAARS